MSFAGESNSSRGAGPSAIDQAAASVLASSEILLSAPNNAKLHGLYPTPAECTSTIAQMVCNSGQIRVTTNSKSLNGASNFHISSASILDPPILNVELDLSVTWPDVFGADGRDGPIGVAPCGDGWLFNLIESIEVTFSNSNLSNLILKREALREWTLAQCRGREQREELLKNAGCGRLILLPATPEAETTTPTASLTASLPLSFLAWQGANVDSGFGFDARTVNGIIQLQINWARNIYSAFTLFRCIKGVVTNTYSTEMETARINVVGGGFRNLYLSFRSYQLMDSTFSVANALATDPYLKYALPGKWVNTYRIEVDGSNRAISSKPWGRLLPLAVESTRQDCAKITMELTSAPAGMLQAIGIHVRPITGSYLAGEVTRTIDRPYGGGGAEDQFYPSFADSLALDAITLQYSGQNIIQLNTKKEIDTYMKFIYGDDFTYYTEAPLPGGSASCGAFPVYMKDYDGPIVDGAEVPQPSGNVLATVIANAKGSNIFNPADRGYGKRKGQIYILPLMHNGRQVFQERHFENLPQYSGSTLTLSLTVLDDTPYQTPYEPGCSPYGGVVLGDYNNTGDSLAAGGDYGGGALNPCLDTPIPPYLQTVTKNRDGDEMVRMQFTRYEVFISYYVAALVVNSNGMVELQI